MKNEYILAFQSCGKWTSDEGEKKAEALKRSVCLKFP